MYSDSAVPVLVHVQVTSTTSLASSVKLNCCNYIVNILNDMLLGLIVNFVE